MAVFDRYAIAVGADAEAGFDETRTVPTSQNFLWFLFHFFFFAADEWNDVAENIERRHTWIAGARDRLHGDNKQFLQAKCISERFKDQHQAGGGAIGIGDYEARYDLRAQC